MHAETFRDDRTRIVLVDDHPIVREGIRARLEIESDFAIVGELADGERVMETMRRLDPDVVVLDLKLPGKAGLELAKDLVREYPDIRIIILSVSDDEAYVARALFSGVRGYVAKSAPTAQLVEAIRTVMDGERYLSSPHSNESIDIYMQRAQSGEFNIYQTLTKRERQVADMIVDGMSSREIAIALGNRSERTVESHRTHIRKKLGAHTVAEMVKLCIRYRDETGSA